MTLSTPTATNDHIANYISDMCRQLAGMAKQIDYPIACDLLILAAVHVERSPQIPKDNIGKLRANGAR